jgi:hypothetical protein
VHWNYLFVKFDKVRSCGFFATPQLRTFPISLKQRRGCKVRARNQSKFPVPNSGNSLFVAASCKAKLAGIQTAW